MSFIRENSRFLCFGLMLAFLSSIGQTYFIGIFRLPIAEAYGLSNSSFGFYYLLITLGSALGLNRLGHIIDRMDLRRYTIILVAVAAVACLGVGLAQGFWMIMAALLFVRLIGQGLLTHAAMTSMSRYFDKRRGFAVALAGLGFPLGQAIMPPLAVTLMVIWGWQQVWLLLAGAVAIVAIPALLWLLRGHDVRHQQWLESEKAASTKAANDIQHKRRGDVLRDLRFYFMVPTFVSGGFWITGVFFFAADIAAFKSYDTISFTGFYSFYALGSVAAPFLGGFLVDRFGGQRLMAAYPLVFALGLYSILPDTGSLGVALFMALLGFGAGVSLPINNAVWAELYGTRFLGEIKSLATSIVVLSTALSPFLLGYLLDQGIGIDSILRAGAMYCIVSSIILFAARMLIKPEKEMP